MLRRIRHLISWLPIIWNDRDWDWEHLVIILNRKLSNMERLFSSDDAHLMNSDKTRDQIKYARILTDRILADEYLDMAFRIHEKKWGRAVYGSIPSEGGSSKFTVDFPNVKTEMDKKHERRDARTAFLHYNIIKNQDIDELFATMANHIRGWWD